MQKVIVIVGPTASGKSALGVRLARQLGGEVISADSRQVYRGLDIGTGKITKREMRGVPHHLLDVASPRHAFSAGNYVRLASKAHSSILQKARMPVVVGGTGFYIDALLGRVTLPDVPPNAALRARLHRKSAAQLYALLIKRDPKRAAAMATQSERNNKPRLIRALEIAEAIGQTPMLKVRPSEYDALWIGLAPTLRQLEKSISARLRARMKRGMVAEAKRLHAAGLSYRRMEELGLEYRSLARHLRGDISKAEMVSELERDIRRYAKKQLSYWKRNKEIRWFKPSETARINSAIRAWLGTTRTMRARAGAPRKIRGQAR